MNESDVIHSGPTDLHVSIKRVFNLFWEFFSPKRANVKRMWINGFNLTVLQQVWSASLLQLSCINRTVLLFSLLFRLHPTECLSSTNNFSSSHIKFRYIFAHFHRHITYPLYWRERLPTWLFLRAVISAPDHWTARIRNWRSPCVERNNLPSVFPFSKFSNPSDFTLL